MILNEDVTPMRRKLPETGIDRSELLTTMASFRDGDCNWHGGKTWSLVYHVSDEHKAFLAEAHALFMSTNLLNPMAFRSLKRMEAEVVQMSASLLNGDKDVVGTMTSGGTESILLAVKGARDRARRKFWIRNPEIVVPETIHVAFEKGCHYFGLKMKRIPVDANFQVDVAALKRAVTRNTVLIGASAPQYVHGMIDPIEEIGAFAKKKGIPFHVDACFGGFMQPWLEKLGLPMPVFDFRVPGVTSISADVHKYGYAAKGASVVLYRDMSYLKHQFFISTDWSGGIYASPTIQGTRPGGAVAAAWASMMALGDSGYLEIAERTLAAKNRLLEGIKGIDGLAIMGSRHSTIVTWRSDDDSVGTFAIADQLAAKGWSVDRQQHPASVHCTVNATNDPVIDAYLEDLRDAVKTVRANPDLATQGEAAMYGMMAKIPLRGAVKMSVGKVMEQMYEPGVVTPALDNVGGGDDASPLLKVVDQYGPQLLRGFDKFDRIKKKFRRP